MTKLLTLANPKLVKGIEKGYNTYILHLAPYTLSGKNVCPKATAGCIAGCLNTAGRGGMFKAGETTNVVQTARLNRTNLFWNNRTAFMAQLVTEIEKAIKQSQRKGLIPVFRLNGTSDLSWEKYPAVRNGVEYANVFAAFPDVQFYDYTKVLNRKVSGIKNYHLTFSKAENNDADVNKAIDNGMNVAVVFNVKRDEKKPASYKGLPVYDGDKTDLRFLDPKGYIIGLFAKGKAALDTSGFVVMLKQV